jgi:prohibitin 2
MDQSKIKYAVVGFLLFFLLIFSMTSFTIVVPGHRGVKVTLGETSTHLLPEGVAFKMPFISDIHQFSVKNHVETASVVCYSSDLQSVTIKASVMYRIPESSVIQLYRDYGSSGVFASFVAPRVAEAIKENTSLESAEGIVKKRETIKQKSIESAKKKLGDFIVVDDIVLENIDLSDELEHAIEAKMVQEQEAAKAKYTQQKAEIEAKTAIIKAEGEAKALAIQGTAIRSNPETMQMELIKKWNGVSPQVISGGAHGANIILPLK